MIFEENKIKEIAEKLKTLGLVDYEREIRVCLQNIESHEDSIQRGLEYVKKYSGYKKIEETKLAGFRKAKQEEKDYSSDVEAILSHPTVVDVEVDFVNGNKYVHIITDYIHIYDENGNKFHGNKYKVRLDFDNMSVKFFGLDDNYNRESCWGEGCPHPHVSTEGVPCLGDAGSMLAMTMNEYELYASYIITLNFLQQVNVNDGAGEYIYNWDCIDEEGNIIENPYQSRYTECEDCGTRLHEEDAYYCYECNCTLCCDHAYYIEGIDSYVCESCRDNYFDKCNECHEWHRSGDMEEIDDELYCTSCAEDRFIRCDDCGNFFSDTIKVKEDNYCEDCYARNAFKCNDCGETELLDEEYICDKCHESYCNNCFNHDKGICNNCTNESEEK